MSEIPSLRKRFFERKWVVELLSAVPPIIAALYVAYASSKNPTTAWATRWLLAGVGWLMLASLVKIRHAASEEDKKSPKDSLYAALCVVRAAVAGHLELQEDKASDVLRMTLHRVPTPRDPKVIEQVTPYVGGSGGEPGRQFLIQTGVGGKAARTGKPWNLILPDTMPFDERLAELQTNWGYTDADARQVLARNRKSFAALPIKGKDHNVIGVIYLDSTSEVAFLDQPLRGLLVDCCSGITLYISEKYL